MEKTVESFRLNRIEWLFLGLVYFLGLFFRLWPRLLIDPHFLTMNADVWERLAMAQYFLDHGSLPQYCLRYLAYGHVPFWYPPLGPIVLGILVKISSFDLPTVCSRIMPFIETLTPLTLYFLSRWLFGRAAAYISTIVLALTPSFIYWTGITTPTSFTIFLMPAYILLLLIRNDRISSKIGRLNWIAVFAVILAVNFMTHLTYFLALAMLLPIALLIFIKSAFQWKKILDFFAAVLISQLITAFWWGPHNLYSWWIFKLATSSGYKDPIAQLQHYGIIAGGLGLIASFLYFWKILSEPRKCNRYDWLPLVWIIIPFIETQNEAILKLIHRLDLSWYTVYKPLEGYRFHCFLSQPLALMVGWVGAKFLIQKVKFKKLTCFITVMVLSAVFCVDLIYISKTKLLFQNSGLNRQEYQAMVWFRNNSTKNDRIIADYYFSQMFAGVCGGRALLGGLFPLKNTNLPYITYPAVVQDDICTIYTTPDPKIARDLMLKYRCTAIYISPLLISSGNIGGGSCKGFGVKVNEEKFENREYFREVYNIDSVRIIKINADPLQGKTK
ncbi:MAG: hypothetical protein NT060_01245 [Candidatus Omnitrophica bacterium]|nr:hypothetical protein [Candidatus Omnitrophota bacterium]